MKTSYYFFCLTLFGWVFPVGKNTLEVKSICDGILRAHVVYYDDAGATRSAEELSAEARAKALVADDAAGAADVLKVVDCKVVLGPNERCLVEGIKDMMFVHLDFEGHKKKIVPPFQGHKILVVGWKDGVFREGMVDRYDKRKRYIVGEYAGSRALPGAVVKEGGVLESGDAVTEWSLDVSTVVRAFPCDHNDEDILLVTRDMLADEEDVVVRYQPTPRGVVRPAGPVESDGACDGCCGLL